MEPFKEVNGKIHKRKQEPLWLQQIIKIKNTTYYKYCKSLTNYVKYCNILLYVVVLSISQDEITVYSRVILWLPVNVEVVYLFLVYE